MKSIPIVLKFGGAHKEARNIRRKCYGREDGFLSGYTIAKTKPEGFVIWINSRQNSREHVDSFFHEMTHLLLNINFTQKKLRKLPQKLEEQLCSWIGYLAKQQFADMFPKVFGRKIKQ